MVIISGECTLYGGSFGLSCFFGYSQRLMVSPVSERKKILLLIFCRSDLLPGKLQKKSIRKVKKCWKAIWQNKLSEFSPLRRVSDSGLCAELTSSQNLKIGHVHQYLNNFCHSNRHHHAGIGGETSFQ